MHLVNRGTAKSLQKFRKIRLCKDELPRMYPIYRSSSASTFFRILIVITFSFASAWKSLPLSPATFNINPLVSFISITTIWRGSLHQQIMSRGFPFFVNAQYRSDTKMYKNTISDGLDTLVEHLESLPDLVDTYHPRKKLIATDFYEVKVPPSEDFKVSIILDPCKGEDEKICGKFNASLLSV